LTDARYSQADDRNVLQEEQIRFFEKKIRPVLVKQCYECHSASAKELKSDLRLDTRAGIRKGGESGAAVVPGNPDDSLLIQVLRYDGLEMPPDKPLPKTVIADFVAWVKQGAVDPRFKKKKPAAATGVDLAQARRFWSFQPIQDHPLPRVNQESWPKTSIDHFVLARLEEQGLHPVAAAGKRTLIRRATFDLLGLPPAPNEIDAFVRDDSPDAFAKVVDRLLESPHYGERWARHWMDVARYAEDQAHSFQPRLYPNGFRYRDWLIRAFNQDLPYDRFIVEQIAGDLLDEPGRRQRLPALGFFTLGPVYYGDQKMFDQYDDRIDTLSRGVLGLTVACARCHDHKFDPIPTQDYYSLVGIIASTEYTEAPLVDQEIVEEYNRAQEAIQSQQKKIDEFIQAEAKRLKLPRKQVEKKLPNESKQKLTSMRQEVQRLKKAAPPKYPFAHSLKDGAKIRDVPVNIRGNPETPGEIVPRRFLSILADEDSPPFVKGSGRLELAQVIVRADNPLTARVIVNRIWSFHFDRGLVGTTSNFGALGERPTHPWLLDHLASRFINQGWSMKTLHRELMTSAVYQLSGRGNEINERADPENRLLWRMNRRRLQVEAWRDAMLSVSGNLDRTVGGPSVNLTSPDNHRRTVYGKISRHDLDSLLRLFDFPDPNITAGSRSVTTVALQQLFVLNSPFMLSQAKALAAHLTRNPDESNADRIRTAFRLVFGREATERDLQRGLEFLAELQPESNTAEGSEPVSLYKWEQYTQVLLSANEFMYID